MKKEDFFWRKNDLNDYRLIGVRTVDEKVDVSCPEDSKNGFFFSEHNIIGKAKPPLLINKNNFKKHYNKIKKEIIDKTNRNKKTEEILNLFFIEGLSILDISKKADVSYSSTSRIIKNIKKHKICSDCNKIIKPSMKSDWIKSGYYWFEDHENIIPIYIYFDSKQYIIKKFFENKNIGYDLKTNKEKILNIIPKPIQWEDKKTKEGLYLFIERIENTTKTNIKHDIKKSLIEYFVKDEDINYISKKNDVSKTSIRRLRKKIDSNTCYSCGQVL